MKKIKSKVNHKDNRGIIADLIENEKINAITYITLLKNKVRGNHYHKKTIQWNFVVSGKVIFISKINGKLKKILGKKNDLVKIDTKEHHAIKALNYSEILVFTKGPRGGKEYESDTFRLKKDLIE
jgi:cupin superfamily acireductone dioxygenase involved in methionine salvage